jgi:hypothetical protein
MSPELPSPRLRLALDQNFPINLLKSVAIAMPPEINLVPLTDAGTGLHRMNDRQLILHLWKTGWDGLVTNNHRMLDQPHEVAPMIKSKLLMIIVEGYGHDPLRATGALLMHLPGLATRKRPSGATVFHIKERPVVAKPAWDFLSNIAKRNMTATELHHSEGVWVTEDEIANS